jgi:hypothetical protein
MNGIIYYWIAAVGICFIFKYGTILQKFRQITIAKFPYLENLYKCCLCMGFWAGVFLTPILFLKQNMTIELIVFPFTTSCISWFGDNFLNFLLQVTNFIEQTNISRQSQPTQEQMDKVMNHPLKSVSFNSTSKGAMPNLNIKH